MTIKIKRAYEPAAASDGFRVLVDRLWPRGLSKQKIKLDLWLKEIAPSAELREWFNHDPAKFTEFKRRYGRELTANPAVDQLRKIDEPLITLVYGAKDEQHNQAVVLKEFLDKA